MQRKTAGIWMVFAISLFLIYTLVTLRTGPAQAQSNFTWPDIALVKIVAGFTRPVHITHAGDGSGRLFVVEQAGRIKIIHNGQLIGSPFLDISDRVRSPDTGGGGEEGLLSLAFPPGYGKVKNHFYVYYTRLDGDNQLSRFYLSSEAHVANANSEEGILTFAHPTHSNHNGGLLVFGPEGYLYIGTGDGGGAFDPYNNAQDPLSLLGKLLRIDVESLTKSPSPGDFKVFIPVILNEGAHSHDSPTYLIPPSNPFIEEPGYRGEIWSLGLRNPWRYSFDRTSGDLYIADVGQSDFEEVNFQPASSLGGENYGWDYLEGGNCLISSCADLDVVMPVAEYSHNEGQSITGGFVYRGNSFPDLDGIYFYADFISGKIWGLQNDNAEQDRVWASNLLLDTSHRISTFGEDQSGELFLADYATGEIYQLTTR